MLRICFKILFSSIPMMSPPTSFTRMKENNVNILSSPLASGHLALCTTGRTFKFRNIVFHVDKQTTTKLQSCAPTNQYCAPHTTHSTTA